MKTQIQRGVSMLLITLFVWFLYLLTDNHPSIGDTMRCNGVNGRVKGYTKKHILIENIPDTNRRQRTIRDKCIKISIPPNRIEIDSGYYQAQKRWIDTLSD